MRALGRLIAAAAGALLLAAAPAEAQTKLRFLTNFDANTVKTWQPILEAYEKANPHVKVTMETVAGSGAAIYPDVLRSSMAAGDPPDVFFMWDGEIAGPFIDAGQVMDLGALYRKHGWKTRMTPWTVDAIKRNGKVWDAIPYIRHQTKN